MTRSTSTRGVALWIALAGVPAFAACNMITGADDVRFSDDDGSGASSASASSGGGSTNAVTAAQSTGSGVGGATSSNAVASTNTTGAGAGPTDCEYPAGPYGVAQGATVPPSLSWQGYVPGGSSPTTISIQDLFDCDGTRGIDAIIIDTSQYG